MSKNTSGNKEVNVFNKSLSRNILLCVLEENLDQLAILRNINGWDKEDHTVIEYKTVEEQCREIKNYDASPEQSKEKIDLNDFRRDCAFIEKTVQETFDEVRVKGTYVELSRLKEIYNKLESDEEMLHKDTKEKEQEYIDLQDKYFEERGHFRKEINNVMTEIGKLKDEIEIFKNESEIKSKYITSWQNSKIDINNYALIKKEEQLKNTISNKQHDFVKEDRVNQEIINIFKEVEIDANKDLRKWQIKYDNDYQALASKIDSLQEKRDKKLNRTAELVKTYIKRQEEIDAYKEYKIKQEQQRKEKERRDHAAIIIQAWWRGTMVRKGFGKYKKKKDKKGKKKSPSDKKK